MKVFSNASAKSVAPQGGPTSPQSKQLQKLVYRQSTLLNNAFKRSFA